MTDIDVPDWVVEAALTAYVNAWDVSVTGAEKCTTSWDDEQIQHARAGIRAALRAALSAWVVPQHQCMCTDEDDVPNGPRDIWMDVSADDYQKLTARNDVRGRTLYKLRQEKPE